MCHNIIQIINYRYISKENTNLLCLISKRKGYKHKQLYKSFLLRKTIIGVLANKHSL